MSSDHACPTWQHFIGYLETDVIILGRCSNHHICPRFQIWLVPWHIRLSGLEKKEDATQIDELHYKILGKWIMDSGPETRVHHYAKEKMRRWLMDSATIHREFQKDGFPQLCEQEDNICQIKWYNDVCSRKHTQLIIGWKVHPKYGLGSIINVRMVIQ